MWTATYSRLPSHNGGEETSNKRRNSIATKKSDLLLSVTKSNVT